MTVRSWFINCSSATGTSTTDDATTPLPGKPSLLQSPKLFSSDTSTISSSSTISTLESNLSLQTLPSVPSLQKYSPEYLTASVSYTCLSSFKPHTSHITSVAVSGKLLYAASGYQIHVYDLTAYTHLDTFNDASPNSGSVKSVTFANEKVVTAHQDGKIRVWQITATKRHQLVATLPTVKDRLRRFVLPKNYITVRRHKKRLWIEHVDAVSGLSVNNGLIYSVSWDKCLKIWRSKDLICLESVKVHEDAVNSVAVSDDGTVYTGSADRRIRVWTKPFGEKRHSLLATLEKHKSAVNALALSDDGSVLFSGACDRSILVWEREDSAHYMVVTGALRGHTGAILCLVNVSGLLISGSADRTVRIWQRRRDGKYSCLAVMEGHQKPVKSLVAVSDGGNGCVSFCSGSLDGEIKVWEVSVSNLKESFRSRSMSSGNLE